MKVELSKAAEGKKKMAILRSSNRTAFHPFSSLLLERPPFAPHLTNFIEPWVSGVLGPGVPRWIHVGQSPEVTVQQAGHQSHVT